VGDSRKLYYGKDGVLVKVVEPTSVASGWLDTTMAFLAGLKIFRPLFGKQKFFAFNFQGSKSESNSTRT